MVSSVGVPGRVLAVLTAIAALSLTSQSPLGAQDGSANGATPATTVLHSAAPVASAARRTGSISVDGRLDEAAWAAE